MTLSSLRLHGYLTTARLLRRHHQALVFLARSVGTARQDYADGQVVLLAELCEASLWGGGDEMAEAFRGRLAGLRRAVLDDPVARAVVAGGAP